RDNNFYAVPSALLRIYKDEENEKTIREFFAEHAITRAIVKPATGGSSIGVFSVSTPEEAIQAADTLFSKRMDTRVVIEPFVQGREFTVIILENKFRL